jgi:2-methylcitrate dehydratase PrpD
MTKPGATRALAQFVFATRHIPEAVRNETKRVFVNYLGCALGGSQHEAITIAERALSPMGGPPQATVLGRSGRRDILLASLLNCLSASIYSFDDTHAQAIVHAGSPVASALFALAETKPVSGADFMLALALGLETVCRLSMAVSVPPAAAEIAWLQTGISGGVGAALGAGRLLGLNEDQLTAAIGIAAAEASGTRAATGMSFALTAAHACQTGLRAALLAAQGFGSRDDTLEGQHGFAAAYSKGPNLAALTDGLGTHFETLAMTYKPYPCGVVIHPAIEACLDLRAERGVAMDTVSTISLRTNPMALTLASNRHPKNQLEAQVSLYHWVAAALTFGAAGLEQGAAVNDPAVVKLRDRIEAAADQAVAKDAAELTVVLADGERLVRRIDHCLGGPVRPMSNDELSAKFMTQACRVLKPNVAQAVLADGWRLDSMPDVGALARACAA